MADKVMGLDELQTALKNMGENVARGLDAIQQAVGISGIAIKQTNEQLSGRILKLKSLIDVNNTRAEQFSQEITTMITKVIQGQSEIDSEIEKIFKVQPEK